MPKATVPKPAPDAIPTDSDSDSLSSLQGLSYEAALQELEQLVARIESGNMPLDQMLTGYQRGAQLLALCRSRLETVQNQIQVLDDGVLQPWTGS